MKCGTTVEAKGKLAISSESDESHVNDKLCRDEIKEESSDNEVSNE